MSLGYTMRLHQEVIPGYTIMAAELSSLLKKHSIRAVAAVLMGMVIVTLTIQLNHLVTYTCLLSHLALRQFILCIFNIQ